MIGRAVEVKPSKPPSPMPRIWAVDGAVARPSFVDLPFSNALGGVAGGGAQRRPSGRRLGFRCAQPQPPIPTIARFHTLNDSRRRHTFAVRIRPTHEIDDGAPHL